MSHFEEYQAPTVNRDRTHPRGPDREEAGFTLVELLVVLVILGLVTAIAAPQVLRYLGSSKIKAGQIQIKRIVGTLDLYRLDVGRYPTQVEGLVALVERPESSDGWNGPYLRDREGLVDPWGRSYQYRFPGEHGTFDVYSLGADGQAGGEGQDSDIESW